MKVEENIVNIISENLEVNLNLIQNRSDKLVNYGMDSVVFIMCVIDLEEEFNILLPESFLIVGEDVTLDDFIKVVYEII